MNDFDIVFIGHFAIDTIIYKGIESNSIGGGVAYGSLAAYHYNNKQKTGIFSEIGRDFNDDYFKLFKETDIDIEGVLKNSRYSTNYKLIDRKSVV